MSEWSIPTTGLFDPFCGCGTTTDGAEEFGCACFCRPYGTHLASPHGFPAMNGWAMASGEVLVVGGETDLAAIESHTVRARQIAQRFSAGVTDPTNQSSPAGTTEPCTPSTRA